MKKYLLIIATSFLFAPILLAQTDKNKYPEPEFTNEVYWFNKDSLSVNRLEKGSSKMESKTKLGGMGGGESGYSLDGERSTMRLTKGNNLSFVFSTGASVSSGNSQRDSMMRANGFDPSMMSGMGASDPSSTITLYKVASEKGKRKVLLMKMGGALPFASKKPKSSDKYTFSVRKIREGYWELVVDKSLPRGEYAFTMIGMGMGSSDGSTTLFAFGID